jgi:hypothetical protein
MNSLYHDNINSHDSINNKNIEMIKIQFNNLEVPDSTPLKIRIINKFYTILDLLEEVCSLKNLDIRNFIFLNEKEEKVSVLQTVSSFLNTKNEEMGEKYLLLKMEYTYNQSSMNSEKEKNKLNLSDSEDLNINKIEDINILDENLQNIEDNIIIQTEKIILYMFFIIILLPWNLSGFKILEGNYIYQTVENQIINKPYPKNNNLGLKNNFQSIIDIQQFNDWMKFVFPKIFKYKAKEGKNITISNLK